MSFPRVHGMSLGGLSGELYTAFDPDWWMIHLWLWWIWHKYMGVRVARLWRACTPWVKRRVLHTFDTGVVTIRIGAKARDVRVYRRREQWLVWMPEDPPATATRVAADQPDHNLPPTNDVHPMERGL